MKSRPRPTPDPQFRDADTATGEKRIWLAKAIFLLFCLETLFSVPYRNMYLLRHSAYQSWIAGCCMLAIIGICFTFRRPVLLAAGRMLRASSIGDKAWLSFWLILGLALRFIWIVRFPVTYKSDHLAYFQVAASMAKDHTYTGGFWPPGLSLFLTPWFMIFGAHRWVTELCALIFFVATYFLAYALAKRLQGGLAARIAPMLVSLWPGYLTLAGINCKENFLAVLVPAALFFYLKAFDSRSLGEFDLASMHHPGDGIKDARFKWGFLVAAGVSMGCAALTQPGYLLFSIVIFVAEMLRGESTLRAIGRTIVFSIVFVATILPWTCRNYLIFHRVVLISTNGGSVFYRANNPLANANFSDEGEIPLPKDEFAANRLGYQLAEAWIMHHPGAFGALAVRKQVVFLGDDSLGPYETLKRDLNPSGALYASVKGISNLFWLAMWIVLLFGLPFLFRFANWRIWYGLLFLPFVYQWTIDSIFESGPRHHVPYLSLIAVLVSMILGFVVQEDPKSNQRLRPVVRDTMASTPG